MESFFRQSLYVKDYGTHPAYSVKNVNCDTLKLYKLYPAYCPMTAGLNSRPSGDPKLDKPGIYSSNLSVNLCFSFAKDGCANYCFHSGLFRLLLLVVVLL